MKKFILFLIIVLFSSCAKNAVLLNTIDNSLFIEKNTLPIIQLERGNFLIDTGSNSSFISIEYLKSIGRYDLKDDKYGSYSSIITNIEYKTSYIDVKIDTIKYRFKTISMYNLNKVLPVRIIGILGSDFLRENKLIIDYKTRSIHK